MSRVKNGDGKSEERKGKAEKMGTGLYFWRVFVILDLAGYPFGFVRRKGIPDAIMVLYLRPTNPKSESLTLPGSSVR